MTQREKHIEGIDQRSTRGKELAARLNKETILEYMPKLYFVEDFGMGRYRVGRTDWPGDVFELVPRKEFDVFRKIYQSLNMPLLVVNDDNTMTQADSI